MSGGKDAVGTVSKSNWKYR